MDNSPTFRFDDIPAKRRPVVPATEAQARLVDVAITLLHSEPFDQVTARRITAAAGLSLLTISRNFGSMEGLFSYVTKVLLDRSVERNKDTNGIEIFFDPDFVLRTRLVAWLIAEGANPAAFQRSISRGQAESFVKRIQQPGVQVAPMTEFYWLHAVTLMIEGYAVFAGVHNLSPEQAGHVIQLVTSLAAHLPAAEQDLGWAEGSAVGQGDPGGI
ncbi:unannotated protein [freshwater metagenome]|uniref:Unannotated protein n=1 Tax=freshwater metagenome TaxID=449393 RepID=A0A6J7ESM7_9ZZZZ|nr:TetR family transcriptional regulator [Actinomycetota bacterium]